MEMIDCWKMCNKYLRVHIHTLVKIILFWNFYSKQFMRNKLSHNENDCCALICTSSCMEVFFFFGNADLLSNTILTYIFKITLKEIIHLHYVMIWLIYINIQITCLLFLIDHYLKCMQGANKIRIKLFSML